MRLLRRDTDQRHRALTWAYTCGVATPARMLLSSETTLPSCLSGMARPRLHSHMHGRTLRGGSWLLTSALTLTRVALYGLRRRAAHTCMGVCVTLVARRCAANAGQSRFRAHVCTWAYRECRGILLTAASRKRQSGFLCRCTPARLCLYHPMELSMSHDCGTGPAHGPGVLESGCRPRTWTCAANLPYRASTVGARGQRIGCQVGRALIVARCASRLAALLVGSICWDQLRL